MMSSGRTTRRFDNFFTGDEREGYGDPAPAPEQSDDHHAASGTDELEEHTAVAA